MGLISKPTTYATGGTVSASNLNALFDTIYNEFNGNISDANLADGSITSAKLASGVVLDIPAGAIMSYGAAAAPTGWLLCDGSAVSRSTYAALFDIIGTTFGAGNGSTTFNLPNLKGKVPVGLDSAQTEFDALAETGGAKTHTLTTAEMPAHTHTVPSSDTASNQQGLLNNSAADGTKNTSSVGGGGAHNNLQPYLVVNYIIKF